MEFLFNNYQNTTSLRIISNLLRFKKLKKELFSISWLNKKALFKLTTFLQTLFDMLTSERIFQVLFKLDIKYKRLSSLRFFKCSLMNDLLVKINSMNDYFKQIYKADLSLAANLEHISDFL